MADTDRQPALAGGIGAGVGVGVAAVIERFFTVSFLVSVPTAAAAGGIVAASLVIAIRH